MPLWKKAIGGQGYTVTVTERRGSRFLSLYFWDPSVGNMRWRTLGHANREQAEVEAMEQAKLLRDARKAETAGVLTLGALFAWFEAKVVEHEATAQKAEDERRLDIWRAALGPLRDVTTIDRDALDTFCRQRRAGTLVVPGRQLRGTITERTVGADLEFLRRVFNWAATVQGPDKRPICTLQPLKGYEIPDTPNPKRPVATYDRWLLIREHADGIDGQRLFGGFMDALDGYGWRVTALCEILVGDVDLTKRHDAPCGRLKKQGKVDKEGMEMWVPMSRPLQTAFHRLLEARTTLGNIRPEAPLFPAPGSPSNPWTRHHARDLLELAEKAAGLEPLDGGDFHPYRRAWGTARKHLPLADVAYTGGWKSIETLQRCYQQVDPGTMLDVVSERKRVRAPKPGKARTNPSKKSSRKGR